MTNEEIYTAKVGGYINKRVSGKQERFIQVKDDFGHNEKKLKKIFIALTILYFSLVTTVNFLKNLNYFWSFADIGLIILLICI